MKIKNQLNKFKISILKLHKINTHFLNHLKHVKISEYCSGYRSEIKIWGVYTRMKKIKIYTYLGFDIFLAVATTLSGSFPDSLGKKQRHLKLI